MAASGSRRKFLRNSAETVTLAAAVSALGNVHAFGAENSARIRLGIIGCGGIMTKHVTGLVERKEAVEIAWLCDVDPEQIEKTAGLVVGFQSAPPRKTKRFEVQQTACL